MQNTTAIPLPLDVRIKSTLRRHRLRISQTAAAVAILGSAYFYGKSKGETKLDLHLTLQAKDPESGETVRTPIPIYKR